jgi:hypothetical protein
VNLPDPKRRLGHVIIVFAILMLAWLCVAEEWLWVFFFTVLLNLLAPAWRAQVFRPAGSLAGFFVFSSLLIFAVPIVYLYLAFTYSKAYDPAPPSVVMEAIFVATISLGGFLLSRRHATDGTTGKPQRKRSHRFHQFRPAW